MNEFGNVTIFECDHSLWLRIVHCVWHHDLGSSRDSIYFECLHLFATILVFWLLFWLLLLLVALLLLSIIIPINCYFQSHLCLCCQQYSLSTLFEASTTFCQYSSSIWCFFSDVFVLKLLLHRTKFQCHSEKLARNQFGRRLTCLIIVLTIWNWQAKNLITTVFLSLIFSTNLHLGRMDLMRKITDSHNYFLCGSFDVNTISFQCHLSLKFTVLNR